MEISYPDFAKMDNKTLATFYCQNSDWHQENVKERDLPFHIEEVEKKLNSASLQDRLLFAHITFNQLVRELKEFVEANPSKEIIISTTD